MLVIALVAGHNHSHSQSDEESSSGGDAADKSAGGHNHHHDNMNGRLRFSVWDCVGAFVLRRHMNDEAILFSVEIISIIVHVQTF